MRIELSSRQAGWTAAVDGASGEEGGGWWRRRQAAAVVVVVGRLEDLTVFFVVALWNSCLSPLLPSPLLLFLSITAGVMRLPWACSATEAQSQWIIIFKIHQQGGCNFERLRRKKKRESGKRETIEEKSETGEEWNKTTGQCIWRLLGTVYRISVPPNYLLKCFPLCHLTLRVPITFCLSLPTVSVLNAPTVWLWKPQFSVNLLEKDHAKHSTPFPINDAALGSKIVND